MGEEKAKKRGRPSKKDKLKAELAELEEVQNFDGGMNIPITRRQQAFIEAQATEVLFGGAAGGGKSYGQLIDALLYALRYPGSKQLILRRTFSELEKSLIRVSLQIYPKGEYTYHGSNHTGRFRNGSLIDFGYLATENDVFQYQSAEYDIIRFDELTHFTESQYIYLISRLRGVTPFPRQVKSSTNPGSIGHAWVKARFIDPAPPNTPFLAERGTSRIFIPSKVTDNKILMKNDPDYIKRLENLDETQKRALLYGDWDIFEGQYFGEFNRELHVVRPFDIPAEWRRYRVFDYGLDRFACLWIAVDSARNVYVYREHCESNLTISEAAKKAVTGTPSGESIYLTYAPPDMWSRTQDTGRSKADIFYESGLRLTKSSNDREAGWLAIKELLRIDKSGEPRLRIFSTCTELIRCIPLLVFDKNKPSDCATEPHDITHAPDALRYFAVMHFRPNPEEEKKAPAVWRDHMWEDYNNAQSDAERETIIKAYGNPFG